TGLLLSYHRQPDGSYAEVTRWDTPRDPSLVSVADFDLDGVDDALFVNGNDCCIGSATVFHGEPNGTITPVFSRYIGPYPGAGTADIDGDGRPDLATFLGFYNRIGFLLNTTLVDEPTPTLLALVSAETSPGVVRLEWFGETGVSSARVERRTSGTAWNRIADVTAEAGLFRHEDRNVAARERYGYRLTDDGGGEPISEEAWVETPVRPTTSIESVRPNPMSGAGQVSFSLGASGAVRIEVLDVR